MGSFPSGPADLLIPNKVQRWRGLEGKRNRFLHVKPLFLFLVQERKQKRCGIRAGVSWMSVCRSRGCTASPRMGPCYLFSVSSCPFLRQELRILFQNLPTPDQSCAFVVGPHQNARARAAPGLPPCCTPDPPVTKEIPPSIFALRTWTLSGVFGVCRANNAMGVIRRCRG